MVSKQFTPVVSGSKESVEIRFPSP